MSNSNTTTKGAGKRWLSRSLLYVWGLVRSYAGFGVALWLGMKGYPGYAFLVFMAWVALKLWWVRENWWVPFRDHVDYTLYGRPRSLMTKEELAAWKKKKKVFTWGSKNDTEE